MLPQFYITIINFKSRTFSKSTYLAKIAKAAKFGSRKELFGQPNTVIIEPKSPLLEIFGIGFFL